MDLECILLHIANHKRVPVPLTTIIRES